MTTNGDAAPSTGWIRADLHIHTPASADYADPHVTYLDILREADRRDLRLIAFTDHNTVAGYERMLKEIEFLEALERANRLTDEERQNVAEYRQLRERVTVLPGFEFTSHFGAHILALFAPTTPLSLIEATLLTLGVPADALKHGITAIPNTRYATEAYEIIHRNGGLVIAAHANGPSGVITETLRMGTSGQARVAATQSPFLSALEFINFYTDHETFTSPGFYNGRTEHYDRRMFCIQGSDAHRLRRAAEANADPLHRHGIGDRYIELQIAPTFEALKALFASKDFDRVRVPKRDQKQWEVDALRSAHAPSERQVLRTETEAEHAWRDIAALANAGGGTLIIGASANGAQTTGVNRPDQTNEHLRRVSREHLTPEPHLSFELLNYDGRDLVRVEVKPAEPPPYLASDGACYVRRAGTTVPANRDELLQLCRRAIAEGATTPLDAGNDFDFPRSGVEIVSSQRRNGVWHYEVRDLRTTAGVTRDRAQGLWGYAIGRFEDLREGRVEIESQVKWQGRLGLWRAYRQGHRVKYDLVHRNADGMIDHVFFGVSDWGLSEQWQTLLGGPATEVASNDAEQQAAFSEDNDGDSTQDINDEVVTPPENWGEQRYRWRGRGGLLAIHHGPDGAPRFDLAMKDKDQEHFVEYHDVPTEKLSDAWRAMIRVAPPRTGIEVYRAAIDGQDEAGFIFCNLRTGEKSGAPWRLHDIEDGTIRQYAARMLIQDEPTDETRYRWWGNIGYTRPMRSQVDLIYRDENGDDHFYYAARRDELQGEWRAMLVEYGEL